MNMKVNQNTANLVMAGMGGAATGAATGIGVYYFFFVRSSGPKDIKVVIGDRVYTDSGKLESAKVKSHAGRRFLDEIKANAICLTPGGNLFILLNGELSSTEKDVQDFLSKLPAPAKSSATSGG